MLFAIALYAGLSGEVLQTTDDLYGEVARGVTKLKLLTCYGQIINLRGNSCVAAASDCPSGSSVPQGGNRCICPLNFYVNVAGTGCVSRGNCGAHTHGSWSSDNPVYMCECNYMFIVNVEKAECECETSKFLHTNGICSTTQCGQAGIAGEKPDATPGITCICDATNLWVSGNSGCICISGYSNINGTCIDSVICTGGFIHVDGYCSDIACGSVTGEKANNTPGIKCICDTTKGFTEIPVNKECECKWPNYIHPNGLCTSSPCSSLAHEVLVRKHVCACNDQDDYTFNPSVSACICDWQRYLHVNGKCNYNYCGSESGIGMEVLSSGYVCKCAPSAILHIDGSCDFQACGSKLHEQDHYSSSNISKCECGDEHTLLNNTCVQFSECPGGFLHVSGVCDMIHCGNVPGEQYSETPSHCKCEKPYRYYNKEINSCVVDCPTGWKLEDSYHPITTCVKVCTNQYREELGLDCDWEYCKFLYTEHRMDLSCRKSTGKLVAVILIPLAVVIAVTVLTVFFVHKKKTGSAKSKRGQSTSRNAVIVEFPSLPDPFYISLPKRDNPNAIVGMK